MGDRIGFPTIPQNVDNILGNLENVRLDDSPSVAIRYESDKIIDKGKMSEKVPSLSEYFAQKPTQNDKSEPENFFNDVQKGNVTDSKEEPVVCRIFAEVPVQQKVIDPATSFFDLIGNAPTLNHDGVSPDFGSNAAESPDDGFSTRLAVGSEEDRRRDAWIPNDRTRQALIAAATSPPGTYFPEKDLLTMPGVATTEDLSDQVQEVVSHSLGEAEAAQRKVLNANDVTQDERGVRELIQAGCYRSAINLTGRLLTIYGQGSGRAGHPSKHSPHSLQLWYTRIALLVKVKLVNVAQLEAEPFGQLEKPDLFFQFYPDMYGGRPGSIASFSFRLLIAELPMHYGKPQESLTRLFNLLSIIRQIINNLNQGLCEDGNPTEISAADRADSLILWKAREGRVKHSVVNCALLLKDFDLAIEVYQQLLQYPDWSPSHKADLHSSFGRLYLQLGDIARAEMQFASARQARGTNSFKDIVDRGLVAVAQNSFNDAYQYFVQANQIEPANITLLNNMSVCLLYGGRIKEAVAILENAVNLNPNRGLNESLIINLCTLYDMESSHSKTKKLALLRQLAKYKADAPTTLLEKLHI